MSILILGAGTFAKDVTDLLRDLGTPPVGYVIDQGEAVRHVDGHPVYDLRVAEMCEELGKLLAVDYCAAIVSPERANLIDAMTHLGFLPARPIIHPTASCALSSAVDRGSIIHRLVSVSAGTMIERHVIVNRGAQIGHDVMLEQFVTVGPNATICGCVTVEESAVIGAGAVILEDRTIGRGARVGAGAVVTHDVPPGVTVVGVPAKEHKRPDEVPAEDW